MMLDWGSSTLDITTAGIVCITDCLCGLGIALCWCWQCLLTVGGKLLPHIVTPLDVTTVAWCLDRPRTFYTLQNARQQRCEHHSDSGQQVSSLLHDNLEVPPVCLLKISVWFFSSVCGWISLHHWSPHGSSAGIWCYLNCFKVCYTEITEGCKICSTDIL